MTTEVKFSGRTYGKAQESAASRAFDEAFSKPKATNMKWGNASFVKTRVDEENEAKKIKIEEPSDPFSFEFDGDRSPKKRKIQPIAARTVVQPAVRYVVPTTTTQPAVRIKTDLHDDDDNDLVVKRAPIRTYAKKSSRKVKLENDSSQMKMDTFVKPSKNSEEDTTDLSQETTESSEEPPETEDTGDDLYIEHDDGSSADVKDTSFLETEEENIFSKKRKGPSDGTEEITVKFRSKYLDPDVYSKFTENTSPRDPVGRLSNSKVVHSNVLKHDAGTTLIVVCSPKVETDIKHTNVETKYFNKTEKYLRTRSQARQESSQAEKSQDESQSEKDQTEKESMDDANPSDTQESEQTESATAAVTESEVTESPVVSGANNQETVDSQSSTGSELPTIQLRKKRTAAAASKSSKKTTVDAKVKNGVPADASKSNGTATDIDKNVVPVVANKDNVSVNSAETFVNSADKVANTAAVNINSTEKVKAAAPTQRKFHRIFRSRNKPLQDSSQETPPNSQTGSSSVETTPDNSQRSEGTTDSSQTSADADVSEQSQTSSQDEVQVVGTEPGAVAEGQGTLKLPLLINMAEEAGDSDVDSSQQSNASDEQQLEENSQEAPQPRRKRSAKPPPAERKIYRSRGSRGAAKTAEETSKKIFSSPKKAAAVYNVRSWQDDEEMPPVLPPPPPAPTSNGAPMLAPIKVPEEPPKLKPVMKKKPSREGKDVPAEMPRLTRAVHWQARADEAFTSLHVTKEHKELYTVVKNVKEAHECQESGETQEFDDDIDYLLEGIRDVEPMSTRCLSCLGLAQKSIIPAFRMHLRAHGTVTKIFGCLQDAASDPSLALCTSALVFMLSRDRLNMDLDQETLNLMLRLLGVDQQEDMAATLTASAARALKRNRDKVQEVYSQFQKEAGSKQEIEIECLTTGNLAMESLLSLTSRRAGEWFKEELRSLGALDHIVDTVCSCIEAVGDGVTVLTNSSLENLKKTDRCLRVLENVTYMNSDNQTYLTSYKDKCLVSSLSRVTKVCQKCLSIYPLHESLDTGKVEKESVGWVVYSCVLSVLRVLLNLTHDNEMGCKEIGLQEGLLETVLLCILQSPQYVPIDLRFDLFVLSLGLLINLVEHCDLNRLKLLEMSSCPAYENPSQMKTMDAVLSLVEVFSHREEAARQLEESEDPQTPEASPNKSGEWRESDSGMEWVISSGKKNSTAKNKQPGKNGSDEGGKDLDDEETFTNALHKAGKHMENSIVAAYVALLVGCLIQENQECAEKVKLHLPDQNFKAMIYMLRKFLGFMNLTTGQGSAGGKSIERVIQILEAFS